MTQRFASTFARTTIILTSTLVLTMAPALVTHARESGFPTNVSPRRQILVAPRYNYEAFGNINLSCWRLLPIFIANGVNHDKKENERCQ